MSTARGFGFMKLLISCDLTVLPRVADHLHRGIQFLLTKLNASIAVDRGSVAAREDLKPQRWYRRKCMCSRKLRELNLDLSERSHHRSPIAISIRCRHF